MCRLLQRLVDAQRALKVRRQHVQQLQFPVAERLGLEGPVHTDAGMPLRVVEQTDGGDIAQIVGLHDQTVVERVLLRLLVVPHHQGRFRHRARGLNTVDRIMPGEAEPVGGLGEPGQPVVGQQIPFARSMIFHVDAAGLGAQQPAEAVEDRAPVAGPVRRLVNVPNERQQPFFGGQKVPREPKPRYSLRE